MNSPEPNIISIKRLKEENEKKERVEKSKITIKFLQNTKIDSKYKLYSISLILKNLDYKAKNEKYKNLKDLLNDLCSFIKADQTSDETGKKNDILNKEDIDIFIQKNSYNLNFNGNILNIQNNIKSDNSADFNIGDVMYLNPLSTRDLDFSKDNDVNQLVIENVIYY